MVITTAPLSSSSSTRRGSLGRFHIAVPCPPVFVQTALLKKNVFASRSRQRSGWTQRNRPSRQQTPGPSGSPAAPRLETNALADKSSQHLGWKPPYRLPRPPNPGPSGFPAALCPNCGHAARDSRCPPRNQDCRACGKVSHFQWPADRLR